VDSEVFMDIYPARQNSRKAAFVLLGVALIAVGLTLLLGRLDPAISHLFLAPGSAGDVGSSLFPTVVLALDRVAQAWAFDRGALLSSVREMLLSCWPVVLVLLGAILLQDWQSAKLSLDQPDFRPKPGRERP
jgi:hypothetical protein